MTPLNRVDVRERHDDGTYEEFAFSTDTAGLFEFSDIAGGLRKCPDVQLHFATEGFVPLDRAFPSFTKGDTILMKPQR